MHNVSFSDAKQMKWNESPANKQI